MRNKKAKIIDPNECISNPGSDTLIVYDAKLMDDGTIVLKEAKKESISQYINSFKDDTDINYIIKRIELGDLSVLNKARGIFGDFTQMPKTYAEALQMNIDTRVAFDQLPAEVKARFDNNYNKWFMDAGSEEWVKNMLPETYTGEGGDQPEPPAE